MESNTDKGLELALEALDRRRKPLYRAKGVVGQTMTHKEWEDQVDQAAKKRLAKASRRHRRRPSLVVPANLRAYLEAQKRTQGIMTEYDYTNKAEHFKKGHRWMQLLDSIELRLPRGV
mgnify:CR=1 FL=1